MRQRFVASKLILWKPFKLMMIKRLIYRVNTVKILYIELIFDSLKSYNRLYISTVHIIRLIMPYIPAIFGQIP